MTDPTRKLILSALWRSESLSLASCAINRAHNRTGSVMVQIFRIYEFYPSGNRITENRIADCRQRIRAAISAPAVARVTPGCQHPLPGCLRDIRAAASHRRHSDQSIEAARELIS